MSCNACNGRLGFYSPDNGQWVGCLHCQEGRDFNAQQLEKSCDSKPKQSLEGKGSTHERRD